MRKPQPHRVDRRGDLSADDLRRACGGGIVLSPAVPSRLPGIGDAPPPVTGTREPTAVRSAVRRFIATNGPTRRATARS